MAIMYVAVSIAPNLSITWPCISASKFQIKILFVCMILILYNCGIEIILLFATVC